MRYYIHIPLPKDLRDRVAAIEFKYQGESGSEPHITLVPPLELCEGMSEQNLREAVNLAVQLVDPLLVTQNGMGYFGNKETIFIGVERTFELLVLHRVLVEQVSGILKPSDGPFADLPTPHITLATHLSPEQGKKAWVALKDKSFFSQFICDKVALLRKGQGDQHWNIVKNFGSFKYG